MDRALADFAELYADQNELDYAALSAAVKTRTRQSADRALAHTCQGRAKSGTVAPIEKCPTRVWVRRSMPGEM